MHAQEALSQRLVVQEFDTDWNLPREGTHWRRLLAQGELAAIP